MRMVVVRQWRGPVKWEGGVVWRRTLSVSKGWPTVGGRGGLVWVGEKGVGGGEGRGGHTRELGYAGEDAGDEAFVVFGRLCLGLGGRW